MKRDWQHSSMLLPLFFTHSRISVYANKKSERGSKKKKEKPCKLQCALQRIECNKICGKHTFSFFDQSVSVRRGMIMMKTFFYFLPVVSFFFCNIWCHCCARTARSLHNKQCDCFNSFEMSHTQITSNLKPFSTQ